jgi:hypothetical protein
MAAILVLMLVAAGAVAFAVLGGEDEEPAPEPASATSGIVTGVLVGVDDDRLVLDPGTGEEPLTFGVRPRDYQRIGIPHLNEHLEQGWPVRIFWTLEAGTRYAERVDDA